MPRGVPMTSFSILMARFQGDLAGAGARARSASSGCRAGDRVLVAEACSHHPIGEDIGRVKIPRWLTQYVGAKLEFAHVQGRDFPADLSPYRLVVHCGNCMGNRREMLSRIHALPRGGRADHQLRADHRVSLGIFERALAPFPAALEALPCRPRLTPSTTPTIVALAARDRPGALERCGSARTRCARRTSATRCTCAG